MRIGEVAACMREHAGGAAGEVPSAPDLSEAMTAMAQSVWAAAWKRAAEQAGEQVAVALDAARAGEADALVAAERAAAERDGAVAARDQALGEVEGLRSEVERLRGQLATVREDASVARAKAEESDRARVRRGDLRHAAGGLTARAHPQRGRARSVVAGQSQRSGSPIVFSAQPDSRATRQEVAGAFRAGGWEREATRRSWECGIRGPHSHAVAVVTVASSMALDLSLWDRGNLRGHRVARRDGSRATWRRPWRNSGCWRVSWVTGLTTCATGVHYRSRLALWVID